MSRSYKPDAPTDADAESRETVLVVAWVKEISNFEHLREQFIAVGMKRQLDTAAGGDPKQLYLGEGVDYAEILTIAAGESHLWVYRLDNTEDLDTLEREHPELDFLARLLRNNAIRRGPEAFATTLPPK